MLRLLKLPEKNLGVQFDLLVVACLSQIEPAADLSRSQQHCVQILDMIRSHDNRTPVGA
jgi:hypothetical protein